MKKNNKTIIIISVLMLGWIIAQDMYEGPDDPAADPAAVREARMDGNRVLLYFKNTTQLSNWVPGGLNDVSIWPNDGTGTRMVDGIGLLIGAKTYILDDFDPGTLDTIIVDDPLIIQTTPDLHEIYWLQTQYREEVDNNETNTVDWTLYPVFGYFNPGQDYPAMSDDPNSWPQSGWPSRGSGLQWAGYWDGRFGKGVTYADLETYFVVNDAQDQEYLQNKWIYGGDEKPELCEDPYLLLEDCIVNCDSWCIPSEPYSYYPKPGYYIQEDASVQPGAPWGGLGIRVESRAFQWNNPLVRDALFWEYTIANISEYNITEVAFGYWVDNAIGSENADDEVGYFDDVLDLSYSWDFDGVGFGGVTPGIMGFAFLESPGKSYDFIDNDLDGLIDEKRDNDAGTLICATCGINDLEDFLTFYDLTEDELHEHWSGDEDQDWRFSETDEQGNCTQLWDDVGLDGIGPNNINYTGPDEGECNGQPDYVEGIGGEPNFAATDVSESDMIGLTTFQLFRIDSHAENNTTKWFKNDNVMWNMMSDTIKMQYTDVPSNLVELFASGTFQLNKGQAERVSMSELHSFDPLTGSPGGQSQGAVALFELKRTIQTIYETDYRFAQPPTAPVLTAEAGDEQVILTWGNISEMSRDPFLPDSLQMDFEGYKIYRATDKYLKDAQVITDGYGNPMFYQPIFQCDRIDGITGFADWSPVFGTSYYIGGDTGLQHRFVDTEVMNGRTYYYAIVAYDFGLEPDDNLTSGIPPSENNAIIELDENEYVISTGPNVAIVTPSAPSAGYVPPEFEMEHGELFGTGVIEPMVFAPGALIDAAEYILTFTNDTDELNYFTTSGLEVYKKLDTPIEWCESQLDCSEFIAGDDCAAETGCSWGEITQLGTWYDVPGSNNVEFSLETGDNFDGQFISQAGILTIFLSENDSDFCTKVVFNSSSHVGLVGTWNSTSVTQYNNDSCTGLGGTVVDLDFSLILNTDLSLLYISYDCVNLSFCEDYEIENECLNALGCNWEIQSMVLVYEEKPTLGSSNFPGFPNENLVHETVSNDQGNSYDYWTLNPDYPVVTDVFDGLQLRISELVDTARISLQGWYQESSPGQTSLIVNHNMLRSKLEPWDYDIIFTDHADAYVSDIAYPVNIYDEDGNPLNDSQSLFINESFDFYIYNRTLQDTMDLVVYDLNSNGEFDKVGDKILVGKTGPYYFMGSLIPNMWVQTNFALLFVEDPSDGVENYPAPGDVYSIIYDRPFFASDSVRIYTFAPDSISVEEHDNEMEKIKVVPNPYVCTNVMEGAIFNTGYNQRRKLMFTHLPSQCTIRIYTVSGVLVDKIDVDNAVEDGSYHWDMQTNENLEIAAGMYIYHVKSDITGKEKLGKFAVVK